MMKMPRPCVIAPLLAIASSTTALAMPDGLTSKCEEFYATYASKSGPKAFAVGSNGYCGWASRNTSSDAEFNVAKKKAVGFCSTAGGRNCKVIESER